MSRPISDHYRRSANCNATGGSVGVLDDNTASEMFSEAASYGLAMDEGRHPAPQR
jgi:hypothetical protein